MQNHDSLAVTNGIRVHAVAHYLAHESLPEEGQYVFAYKITISNEGDQAARLLSRHWIILDADNRREEVKGPGVVGETPRIEPGKDFEYMSGCPLETPWGTMEGSYLFERDDGSQFRANIGRFFLVAPQLLKKTTKN
jgi:ApaG protein